MFYLILISFFYSCNYNKDKSLNKEVIEKSDKKTNVLIKKNELKSNENDSLIKYILENSVVSNDTIKYNFIIGDIASDGDEGIAYYYKFVLKKIEFSIQSSNRVNKQLYVINDEKFVLFNDSLFLFNDDYSKLNFEENVILSDNFEKNRLFFGEILKRKIPFKLK